MLPERLIIKIMPRVRLISCTSKEFFDDIKIMHGISLASLARMSVAHQRSFSDWRSGKCLMPLDIFKKIHNLSRLKPHYTIIDDNWNKSAAGKMGAKRRRDLYGPLIGTFEGRRKGGRISARRFFENPDYAKRVGFVTRKEIRLPRPSKNFAECVGIILGDGTIQKRQIVITLHGTDDLHFSRYVKGLCERIFQCNISYVKKKVDNIINILISSTTLIEFLSQKDMQIGNKVKNQVGIPRWILSKPLFRAACLRGLFDTDGCFYIDKHTIKGKIYFNCALNFTNRSLPLLKFVKEELECRGYHPTQKTPWAIFLRRENEVRKYFSEIGSSNEKHLRKFKGYCNNKQGGVA